MRSVARGAAAAAALALALGIGAWTPYAVAAEPVDLGGQPVESSTDSRAPTALEAGLWMTMLGPESQPQFFTYERQIQGSAVHVGVIGAPETPESDGVSIDTTVPSPDDAAGADCGSADASSSSTYPQAVIGAEVIVGDEDSAEDPCRTAGLVTITVTRYSSLAEDLPIAIKVVEEAPVIAQGSQIPDDDALAYDAPEPVEPVEQPAGSESFDDAPVLDVRGGAVTIDARVTQGTERLWRVPLDWGDQLVARVDLAGGVGTEDPLYSVDVQVELVQPSRDVFALTESEEYSYGYFGEEPVVLLAAANPLRYGNRFRDIEPTLPGDYWVAVSIEPAPADAERGPVDVPVQLTIAASETDVDGPTYQEAVLGQGGGAGPDGYSPDTPYLVGAGEFAAVASGNPFTPQDDDGETWWAPRRGAGIGLGVLSLVCCAVGAVWLTRRRAS